MNKRNPAISADTYKRIIQFGMLGIAGPMDHMEILLPIQYIPEISNYLEIMGIRYRYIENPANLDYVFLNIWHEVLRYNV